MEKTAVVTGGTKGLGRAIAEIFAENGFDICVCARTEADLEAMQQEWRTRFPHLRLHTCPADVGKKAEVLEFADFVRSTWPAVGVLVNNAGIYLPGGVSDEPEGTLETLLETNLFSAYHLTRALLPSMVPHRSGHIFNMCSIASITAYPNGGSYTISKYAMLGFSKSLREELKKVGIKVTSIMPGATWSDSWHGADYPAERLMQSSDVAKAIWGCYNLSDAAVVEELIIRPQLGDL
ncbi:MAG: SDR family oxidoreductase [Saprospiraceae bacterium]|nr:SDR family oxidoreductase [Saprospiraceae bacterium]MCB0542729.1 SDR family oxidoreductase [Saprospiraceae bacterium]MCB0573322.1 SDR family oxidoreductase [Saprospiraceae bacterium]MCB9306664.1 SDR family oxidoreductase [Lewinellaceae bacterium]MCB9353012.1 SDR family oxidoreductase [Lewinellaceae bacterium]